MLRNRNTFKKYHKADETQDASSATRSTPLCNIGLNLESQREWHLCCNAQSNKFMYIRLLKVINEPIYNHIGKTFNSNISLKHISPCIWICHGIGGGGSPFLSFFKVAHIFIVEKMSSHQKSLLFGHKFLIFSQQSGTNQRLTAKRKTYQMSPFYSKIN